MDQGWQHGRCPHEDAKINISYIFRGKWIEKCPMDPSVIQIRSINESFGKRQNQIYKPPRNRKDEQHPKGRQPGNHQINAEIADIGKIVVGFDGPFGNEQGDEQG